MNIIKGLSIVLLKKSIKIFFVVSFLTCSIFSCVLKKNVEELSTNTNYSYTIINEYPHDNNSFTQGLIFQEGYLYEGTGLKGFSYLKKVELETGKVLNTVKLENEFFGEGITIFKDKIIQLTWKSKLGFVYDKESFNLITKFSYNTQGWGLTHDDKNLIMSDGTSKIFFLDPETFQEVKSIEVTDKGKKITQINELEYIEGNIYANIWKEEKIAIINPNSGIIIAWINLQGITAKGYQKGIKDSDAVLNGIAYDKNNKRIFITGKNWDKIFEITLKKL